MEMLPPAPSVVVGAAVEKRFPGYGTYRGTIEEINGGKVVVHWAATDERTSLTLNRRTPRAPTTRQSAARASNAGAARTRSSTGNWCRSPVRAVDRCASAAATSPPPRRRRAPAAARHQ